MSMDLTFLTDSCTQQILQQLRNVREQDEKKRDGFRFDDILSAKESSSEVVSSKAKDYTAYLRETYGNVTVKSVGKDQRSMDDLGMGTAGTGNVVNFVQSKEAAGRRWLEMQNAIKHRMMTDQIRLDLTGERGVLTDRGTDWISALAYMGGFLS